MNTKSIQANKERKRVVTTILLMVVFQDIFLLMYSHLMSLGVSKYFRTLKLFPKNFGLSMTSVLVRHSLAIFAPYGWLKVINAEQGLLVTLFNFASFLNSSSYSLIFLIFSTSPSLIAFPLLSSKVYK